MLDTAHGMCDNASPDSVITVSDPAKQEGRDIEYEVDGVGALTGMIVI